MPGTTPSRCSKNCHAALVPMSERQQLKLVRQLERSDDQRGCSKEPNPQRSRSKSCNGRGETPLHKAAIRGDEELVLKLLNEGADPNIPDFAGWTPLHEACNHGWYEVALALIEAGGSINAPGLDDDTPLHDAAMNGHARLVQLLVESGADVNYRNKNGKTPCDVAAPGLMTSLLKRQAHADSDTRAVLELHRIKKKSIGKTIFRDTFYSYDSDQFSVNMEEKNSKEDVYEFKSSKEATPVRGASASPEVDKNVSEPKSDKSGDGYCAADADSGSCAKRTLTDVVDNDEAEDESKRKKRKEGDGKSRDEAGPPSKSVNSTGRANAVRNVNSGSEKGGKVTGHMLCKNPAPAAKTATSGPVPSDRNLDRKSPGSPKGAAVPSASLPPGNATKTDTEQEEKSTGEGEKMDQGPKVPPLKIVIPQQTANEPEQGNRNGKNGTSRHHQALPYVVSSNSNDGEKEGARSRSVSPTDSFKVDEKKDPAIGMLSAEDQKGSLNHQRVLRSSHRAGSNNNGENRAVDVAASRSLSAGGQNTGAATNTPVTNNSNNNISNNNSNNNSSSSNNNNNNNSNNNNNNNSNNNNNNNNNNNSNNNVNNGAAVASTDNPSPPSQSRSSPSPQVDSNLNTSSSGLASGDGSSVSQNSASHRANSSAPSKATGSSSNSTSSLNSDDKASEGNSESNQSLSQSAAPNPAPVELHPRKRKLKHNKEVKESPSPQVATERCESTAASLEVHPHEQPVKNCYQLFLDIRKQIERRRKGLFPVQPKPPQGFKDYLMNRCTYVLAGNASTRQIPTSPLPQNLSSPMKDLFSEQEKERHRLRLQHVIEKEKLVLSVEQEILRVHGRAARALANQSLPFSACTILKDEEVYNLITPEQEEKDRNARSRYNGRLFLSWLQDVDDKWEKIKEAMLLRHHNEAESLHAVQKMDWEWKMKELGSCEFKSKPVILESHVPMVHVSDDFDLLPA